VRKSKQVEQAPAFQFYPKDWISNHERVRWDLSTQGAYILLCCYAWVGNGRLPEDMEVLARMCNCRTQKMEKMWVKLKGSFVMVGDGTFFNPVIENERKVQAEHKKERAKAGKMGAEARWKK
jgi:uncharacterized protein YdaU (DUF1376 family)